MLTFDNNNNNISFEKSISSVNTPHYKLEKYNINNNGNKQLSYKLYDKYNNNTYTFNHQEKQIIDNLVKKWSSNKKKPCRKSELHHSVLGGKRRSRRKKRKNIIKTRKNFGGNVTLANIEDFYEITDSDIQFLVKNPSEKDYIDAFGEPPYGNGPWWYNQDINNKRQSFYFIRKPLSEELKKKIDCSKNSENYNKNIDFITVYNRVECGKLPLSGSCEGDHVTKRKLSGLYNEYNKFSKSYNEKADECYKGSLSPEKENVNRSTSPATVTDIDTIFHRIEIGGCPSCAARVLLSGKKTKKKSNKKTKKKGGSSKDKSKKAKKSNNSKKKVSFKPFPVTREEGTYSDTEFEIEPGEDRRIVMRNSRKPDFQPYYNNEDDNPYDNKTDLELYFYNNKANKGEYSRCDIGDICEDASIVLYGEKKDLIENEISKLEEKYKGNEKKDALIERDLRENYYFDDIESQFIITSIYQPDIIDKIAESDEVVIHHPQVKKKRS